MSEEVYIVAIMSPAPGKAQRLHELLKNMCKEVHSKEDYTLRYLHTEQIDAEGEADVIMIETYKDKASAKKHSSEQHFKDLFGNVMEENLLAKPPYIAHSVRKSGFDLDRKLT